MKYFSTLSRCTFSGDVYYIHLPIDVSHGLSIFFKYWVKAELLLLLLLLLLKYERCSLYLILNCLLVCPLYTKLQSRHRCRYTPQFSYLVRLRSTFFTFKTLPIVFLVLKALPKFCFLKSFLIWVTDSPTYVNVVHFFLAVMLIFFNATADWNTGTFCVTLELTGTFSVIL